jgi:hypothetical protein
MTKEEKAAKAQTDVLIDQLLAKAGLVVRQFWEKVG